MRLLFDSDVFCKLSIGHLLDDTLVVLSAEIRECGCLPALPYMLRRGKLPKTYGVEACAALVPLAESMQAIPTPDTTWLDRLVSVHAIDPGEAQLFATAARDSLMVVTGDKRALRALKDVEGFAVALAGRIVGLEAILLTLCKRLGHTEVRRRLGSLTATDMTLKVCFSENNPDPSIALESYYRSFVAEVHPLVLWKPQIGGAS